jgi:methylamine dehydrogenase heavy chain
MLAGNIRKLCSGAILAAASCGVFAEVPVDKITVLNLPPATPYRLYLSDMAISHFVDSKLMIIDGESLNVVGHVALGMTGHVTLTPDRSELLVSTAYMTKLNRGERIGQMDVYDASTLKLKAEVSVPPKHSQSMPYRGKIRTSADGRLVYMQNSTPASSVTVVDRIAGKFVAEIATPGCWMIYVPQSVSDRFSTLCGDGTMLTVKLDAEGKPLERKKSAKFFDADEDALFTSGAQHEDNYTFVSFKGNVQTVNVAGDTAVAETQPGPWSRRRKPRPAGGRAVTSRSRCTTRAGAFTSACIPRARRAATRVLPRKSGPSTRQARSASTVFRATMPRWSRLAGGMRPRCLPTRPTSRAWPYLMPAASSSI